jgi:hypothetical protein
MTIYTRHIAPPVLHEGVVAACTLHRFSGLHGVTPRPVGLDDWEDEGGSLAVPSSPPVLVTPMSDLPGHD